MKVGQRIGPVLTSVALIVLYCPVFIWLVRVWLDNPYYTHGFLILPISAFIAWTRRREMTTGKPSRIGATVLIVGLITYVVGFASRLYWLWAFSFLIVISGLTLYFGRIKSIRAMLFPICFLIFMIPLPFLDSLALLLQIFTAWSSASIMSVVGIPVTSIGAEIHLAGSAFTIGMP